MPILYWGAAGCPRLKGWPETGRGSGPGEGFPLLTIPALAKWESHPKVKNDEHSEVRWFDKDGIDRITDLVSDEYRPIMFRLVS